MQERAVTQLKRRERVVYMSKRVEEQENQNMKQVEEQEINFTDYASLDKRTPSKNWQRFTKKSYRI